MNRLSKLKAIFNKNSLRAIILGTALTTALTGCIPSTGNTIPQKPTTEQPASQQPGNGGNGGNEQGGNGGNQNGGNEQGNGGNEQGGGNQQGGDEPVVVNKWGDEPYQEQIGNGNYVLWHALGDENHVCDGNDSYVIDGTNYYLGKAGTYVKGVVNDFETSLNGRPAAQEYFADFIARVKNETSFQLNPHHPEYGFDDDVNTITVNSKSFFVDMIKNLEKKSQRRTFVDCYRILANESKKAGTLCSQGAINGYNNEKEDLIDSCKNNRIFEKNNINIEEEYGENNFQGLTNLMDQFFNTIVENMNSERNLDLQVADLQTIMNLALSTSSLQSLESNVNYRLGHANRCNMYIHYQSTMESTIDDLELAENQSMGL